MRIINTQLPANLFSRPAGAPTQGSEPPQWNLQLGQIVRAIVVAGGEGQVLFELAGQSYLARTEKALQTGQPLRLQLTQMQPHLEFRVLNDVAGEKLMRLLPLLSRPYDWGALVARLQQRLPEPKLPGFQSITNSRAVPLLHQLFARDASIDGEVAAALARLKPFEAPVSTEVGAVGRSFFGGSYPQKTASVFYRTTQPIDTMVFETVRHLRTQIAELKTLAARDVVSQAWLSRTRSLLEPFRRDGNQRTAFALSTATRQVLTDALIQLKNQPKLTPQLSFDIGKIVAQLDGETAQGKDVTNGPVAGGREPVLVNGQVVSRSQVGGGGVSASDPVAPDDELTQLFDALRKIRGPSAGLPPESAGRLEGLITRLERVAERIPAFAADFNAMAGRLSTLLNQPQQVPQRGCLGLLSQLFGFHLEAELLEGKTRAALNGLKLNLLALKEEQAGEVSEPLRRLELFQLCKARLAEDGVQFLPLPFPELEEGYLLAEKRSAESGEKEKGGVHMSLTLRLSALGNVRIDMLYHRDRGMQMQVAGENQEKKAYFESCAAEFSEAVTAVDLKEVAFAADAGLPARQLRERLMPGADLDRMLDARV